MEQTGRIFPRGDVPITHIGGFHATWLTTDDKRKSQLWAGSSNSRVDKTAIRLELEMEVGTPGLAYWMPVSELFNMDAEWLRSLKVTGGDPTHWWIYVDIIPITACNVHTFNKPRG